MAGAGATASGVPGHGPLDPQTLLALPSVTSALADSGGILLTVAEPHLAIPALLERLGRDGLALSRLTTRHASLEDVFVALTGRHLRDD